MREAMFYEKQREKKVKCILCPRYCIIPENKVGFCGVRKNIKGNLYSLVYGKLCSIAVDSIEKKPLFHWSPGTKCLSIATVGCNLDCAFCQNSDISHPPGGEIFGEDITAKKIIEMTKKNSLPGIAYTYSEPLVAFEFYLEVMKLAKKEGLYNVWVSNGYINPEPALEVSRYLHAINIDIKGSEAFYRKLCNAPSEAAVRKAARIYKEQGVWVEITTLVIPGYNDSRKVLTEISRWVRKNLGPETPMHFSRFHPSFRMRDAEPTPTKTLEMAHKIAVKEGLMYVYIGNVFGHRSESTYCPKCGRPLIERRGFGVAAMRDTCECGERLALAGKKWSKLK